MNNRWNKNIHDRLKDFPKKAPEGLWDDIQSEMLRRGLSAEPIANKRPTIVRRIASVAAIILILWGISYLFHWLNPSTLPNGQGKISFPVVTEIRPASEEEKEIPSNEPTISVTSRLSAQVNSSQVVPSDSTNTKKDTLSEKATEEASSQEESDSSTPQIQEKKERTNEVSQQKKWAYTPSRKHTSSFDVSIHYSGLLALNMPFGNDSYFNNTQLDTNLPIGNPNLNNGGKDSTNTASRSIIRSFKRNKNGEEARHHIPVKLGVSFRYYLDNRWNIQSGLTYSYLVSDLSYSSPSTSYKTKQKLHYIGIPLQIGLRIWESERFRGYLSAGGQVEKLVNGKATTHYTMNNQPSGTLIENIGDNKLLFSALASIGAEYMLGKNFSLYAEPGIHYYFKNGNGLRTHYNENPLNFNITVGFRFHWEK